MDLATILQSQLKHKTEPHLNTLRNLNSTHIKIIEHVWLNSEISRSELARKIQLNKSSITRIIDELKLWDVVREQGLNNAKAAKDSTTSTTSSKRGRPPISLKINPELGVVLGIELRVDEYQFVILDAQGQMKESSLRKIPSMDDLDAKGLSDQQEESFFLKRLGYVLHEVQRVIQAEERHVLGLGIGLSGVVHSGKNTLLYSDLHQVQTETPITQLLDKFNFSFPVFLDNDVRCCAWMEMHYNKRFD